MNKEQQLAQLNKILADMVRLELAMEYNETLNDAKYIVVDAIMKIREGK